MYKTILIAALLLLCFGAIARAEPLPLVPGTQGTTEAKTEEKTVKTEQTGETNKSTRTKTETSVQTEVTEDSGENNIEDKEEQAAATDNSGNADVIQSIERGNEPWFTAENKADAGVDSLAGALASDADYRSKALSAARIVKGKEELKQAGQFGEKDIRAAIDALMGWDFTYGAY